MSIELILFITTNQVSAYSRDHNHIPIVSRLSFCIHSKKSVSIRSPNFYKSIIQENKNNHLFYPFTREKSRKIWELSYMRKWADNFVIVIVIGNGLPCLLVAEQHCVMY